MRGMRRWPDALHDVMLAPTYERWYLPVEAARTMRISIMVRYSERAKQGQVGVRFNTQYFACQQFVHFLHTVSVQDFACWCCLARKNHSHLAVRLEALMGMASKC
jgi:hypothetical protein